MDISVKQQEAQWALALKRSGVTMEAMMETINQGYAQIEAKLAELGRQMAGPPYACYTNMSDDMSTFDMELGFPVSEEFAVDSELFVTRTYEGPAIEAVHQGSYDTLEVAYEAMMQYANEQSLELTGVYYEHYDSDPDVTPAEELLTRIVMVIK